MSRQRISDPTRFSRRLAAVDMDDVYRGLAGSSSPTALFGLFRSYSKQQTEIPISFLCRKRFRFCGRFGTVSAQASPWLL